ncbi:hypothetical protein [Streptomyces sp. NPDC051561]|uniref:hypothetical protein n=1 Tax=Streptomyces sp. NPDC051561 TaxID=3365658 RepID=UPI0037B83FCB
MTTTAPPAIDTDALTVALNRATAFQSKDEPDPATTEALLDELRAGYTALLKTVNTAAAPVVRRRRLQLAVDHLAHLTRRGYQQADPYAGRYYARSYATHLRHLLYAYTHDHPTTP